MAFPTTTFTDPTAAISALMNKANENGLGGAVADGFNPTVAAMVANMASTLPDGVNVGRTALATDAVAGFTSGTGTIWRAGVTKEGGLIVTRIFIDLTGAAAFAAGDIIGAAGGSAAAHIGQITTAVNGTIIGGQLRCFEAPAGGDADIDVYSATVATGAANAAISGITGQAQAINSGTLALTTDASLIADSITDGEYLYLVSVGATAATYTAGRICITLFGI